MGLGIESVAITSLDVADGSGVGALGQTLGELRPSGVFLNNELYLSGGSGVRITGTVKGNPSHPSSDPFSEIDRRRIMAPPQRPVWPNPPSPRAVSGSSVTSTNSTFGTGVTIIWAMRIPRLTVNGSAP